MDWMDSCKKKKTKTNAKQKVALFQFITVMMHDDVLYVFAWLLLQILFGRFTQCVALKCISKLF